MEKPKILSDEQAQKAFEDAWQVDFREHLPSSGARRAIAQAQLDADVSFYEPLIQQAKSEVAREIFEEIEKKWGWLTGDWSSDDKVMSIRYFHYQALKQETLSKYGGQKK